MDEHTPTPWIIAEKRGRLILREEPGICDGGDAYTVAETKFHGLILAEQAAANAAFIVKAVNNHEALITALGQIAEGTPDEAPPFRCLPREAMQDIARAALAKVSDET